MFRDPATSSTELPVIPPLADILDAMVVVRLPMAVEFRGVTHRELALIRGPRGYAEFAPFTEYKDPEAATWLRSTIELGWSPPPPAVRDNVFVNISVPAVGAEEVPEVIERYRAAGAVRAVKVKVASPGHNLAHDVARVAAVRAAVGDEPVVRVDANCGWNVAEAVEAMEALAEYNLQYVEQPCATMAELSTLRQVLRSKGVPGLVAADESLRKADDPATAALLGAMDVAVLKVAPLGGPSRVLDIARQLGERDIATVVSSALDSSVGLAAGVLTAVALPRAPLACGLATSQLFEADVTSPPLTPTDGVLSIHAAQAITPDTGALNAVAVPDRLPWWRERVMRCYDVLVAEDTP